MKVSFFARGRHDAFGDKPVNTQPRNQEEAIAYHLFIREWQWNAANLRGNVYRVNDHVVTLTLTRVYASAWINDHVVEGTLDFTGVVIPFSIAIRHAADWQKFTASVMQALRAVQA